MTSSRMPPMGVQDPPGTIPWKVVRLRSRSFSVSPSLIKVSLYRMLIVLPPSYSGEFARELWCCEQSIYHKRITTGIRQDHWVISSAPGYVTFGPVHVLRNQWLV